MGNHSCHLFGWNNFEIAVLEFVGKRQILTQNQSVNQQSSDIEIIAKVIVVRVVLIWFNALTNETRSSDFVICYLSFC